MQSVDCGYKAMRLVRFTGAFPMALAALASDRPPPTWHQDIAPIIHRNCIECHRPGGVGPFSLVEFADAAKRTKGIVRATERRIMPPWLPSSPKGVFEGERGLSDSELALIRAWAEAGAPVGEVASALEPNGTEALSDMAHWRLGPPDVIVRMPHAFPVPSGPGDVYQAFVIPLSSDAIAAAVRERAQIPESNLLGVAGVEIHPGNRRVVHHAHVWVDTSGEARRREATSGEIGYVAFGNPGFEPAGYLGGCVPGTTPRLLPPGIAEAYPLGADLVLQIHYSPSGKPEVDQTEVGIYFTREPVKRTIEWLRLGSFNVEIPAGAAAHVIEDELEIPADCFVISVSPHMHLLGREVHAQAVLPSGKERELLTIPRWNFAWQDFYRFKDPMYLPRGTRVHVRWVFDNSTDNPRNPHTPPVPVHFGPNTSDEMCEFHLLVVPREIEDYPVFDELASRKAREKVAELTPEQRVRYGFERAR